MKKFSRLLCLPVLLGLAATACTSTVEEDTEAASEQTSSDGSEQVVGEGDAGSEEACEVTPPDVSLDDALVGFSQMENNNPWRIAETDSMRAEAEARGVDLIVTDAQGSTSTQVADVEDMIAQGIDILIIAPREFEGLAPALEAANSADVPVFLVDREAKGEVCEDYITFMGSNFIEQGERAGEWLIEATDGEAQVVELEGTTGASVTNDRAEGFRNAIEGEDGIEIIASQSGDFARAGGQEVMEQLLQSNPEVTAVYAHNDEMALGAIQALKDAGRTPGEDVTVVSVDGTRDALQAIIDGEMGATVESNPRFGSLAFATIEKFLAGEAIPKNIILEDRFFDQSNAEEHIDEAY
jgi:ABC-type sugar transport system substrate-binding protein